MSTCCKSGSGFYRFIWASIWGHACLSGSGIYRFIWASVWGHARLSGSSLYRFIWASIWDHARLSEQSHSLQTKGVWVSTVIVIAMATEVWHSSQLLVATHILTHSTFLPQHSPRKCTPNILENNPHHLPSLPLLPPHTH